MRSVVDSKSDPSNLVIFPPSEVSRLRMILILLRLYSNGCGQSDHNHMTKCDFALKNELQFGQSNLLCFFVGNKGSVDADGIYTAHCSECVVTNKVAMSLIFMPSKYWNFPLCKCAG